MPKIFDNIEFTLADTLRQTLQLSTHADFCSGYFNLRGWHAVAGEVDKWPGGEGHCCRLLVGMQRLPQEELRHAHRLTARQELMDNATALRLKQRLAQELREQLVIGLPTNADRDHLLQLAEHLKQGKLAVKCHLLHPLHAKLYLCHRDDFNSPIVGFLGSSNFTLSGLEKQGELNIDVLDGDACQKLQRWFDARWDDRWSLDITEELIAIIESSWVHPVHPYHIYLKMAYHLSREARAGQAEFVIPKDFGATLFEFQTAAIKIAAHHINARGGVVLGDVVGLGKTIMACAIAAIFQAPPYSLETLVICPANLKTMWEGVFHQFHILGKVLSLGETHKLKNERRYRLIVIDESHNLRTGEGSRYGHISDYIQQNESKVVLLSATPYNKHYGDLFHQLRLFIPADKPLGIRPEQLLGEITVAEFTARHQALPNTLAAFGHSPHADDWRELMRLFLVRRTRSFIKTNYAQTSDDGRKYLEMSDGTPFYFPQRSPKTVPFPLDASDANDQYAKLYAPAVVDAINALHLPRYGLAEFLRDNFDDLPPLSSAEVELLQNLSRAGKRLMGFCRTNLFKRLESSGEAFLQSVARHIQRNAVFLYALENHLPVPIGSQDAALLDEAFNDEDGDKSTFDAEIAAQIYQHYTEQKNRFSWLRSDVFSPALVMALREDNAALEEILQRAGQWNPATDRKLLQLLQLLNEQHPRDKILIFSQFADTVRYLGKQLQTRGVAHCAGVTGSDKNPTELAHRFSPRSNQSTPANELRVLIATDVLSEGQNLQDAHIVINYDLPWAIIRLIQRAGRVDRIGQEAPEIICYSFLPAEGVEKLIGLRERLKNRLHENAEVIGADEQFFDDHEAWEVRNLYHEKAGILDEDEGEVDLASHAYQIWKNASDADPKLRHIIPNLPDVVEGGKNTPEAKGAIVYTRTPTEMDVLAWIAPDGSTLTQSQWQILKAASCDATTPAAPLADNHHTLIEAGVAAALDTEKAAGGGLGKTTGARYKAWHVLKRHHESVRGTLFDSPELNAVADALHGAPLQQSAADSINLQFKIGANDQHIVELLLMLHEEKHLVQQLDEDDQSSPRLICSMGLS
jgi:superfamily II DNA or RNA helicase